MMAATALFLFYLLRWKPFTSRVDLCLNVISSAALVLLYFFCLLFSLVPL